MMENICTDHNGPFDDNPGKTICKTCEAWLDYFDAYLYDHLQKLREGFDRNINADTPPETKDKK